MVIASSPLIMMLRHIFTAEATPSSLLATLAAKPSWTSNGASSSAVGPPSSRGTLMR
jgi:hypothetical protein